VAPDRDAPAAATGGATPARLVRALPDGLLHELDAGDAAQVRPCHRVHPRREARGPRVAYSLSLTLSHSLSLFHTISHLQEASPSTSSPVATATDAARRPSPHLRIHQQMWVLVHHIQHQRMWCWSVVCTSSGSVKAAQLIVEGYGAAALFASLMTLPHALNILAASTRLSAFMPRALWWVRVHASPTTSLDGPDWSNCHCTRIRALP
jgi:hypothetical protein